MAGVVAALYRMVVGSMDLREKTTGQHVCKAFFFSTMVANCLPARWPVRERERARRGDPPPRPPPAATPRSHTCHARSAASGRLCVCVCFPSVPRFRRGCAGATPTMPRSVPRPPSAQSAASVPPASTRTAPQPKAPLPPSARSVSPWHRGLTTDSAMSYGKEQAVEEAGCRRAQLLVVVDRRRTRRQGHDESYQRLALAGRDLQPAGTPRHASQPGPPQSARVHIRAWRTRRRLRLPGCASAASANTQCLRATAKRRASLPPAAGRRARHARRLSTADQ